MTSGKLGMLLALCSLCSCGVYANVTDQVADPAYHGTPKRVLSIGEFDNQFSQVAADAFPDALRTAMMRCGVQASVYSTAGRLQLNNTDKLHALMMQFQPDTVLTLHEAETTIQGNDTTSGTYLLTMQDLLKKREIWTASMRVYVQGFLVDRSKAAQIFADRIVGSLASTGILHECPTSPGPSVKS